MKSSRSVNWRAPLKREAIAYFEGLSPNSSHIFIKQDVSLTMSNFDVIGPKENLYAVKDYIIFVFFTWFLGWPDIFPNDIDTHDASAYQLELTLTQVHTTLAHNLRIASSILKIFGNNGIIHNRMMITGTKPEYIFLLNHNKKLFEVQFLIILIFYKS